MSATGNRLISSLCYEDAPAAIAWLEQAFGFTAHLVVPGDNGTIVHSQLKSADGNSMIMVHSVRDDTYGRTQQSPKNLGGSNQALCIVDDDVDGFFQRAVAAGAEIVMPVTEQEYGGSAFTCKDPEGHVWSVGSYDPWADSDQSA